MRQEDCIIIFLLIIITLQFVNEMRRQRKYRSLDVLNDPEKADAIIRTLDKQADVIKSVNGRVDSLGEVVVTVVKILEKDYEQKKKKE